MNEDLKLNDEIEYTRIYKANHYVEYGRVDDCLALSRAFGDFEFKD